jgi:uncharacterized Rmd1/YagE family protein
LRQEVAVETRKPPSFYLLAFSFCLFQIHDGMKEEFDIAQRFEHIEFKLNLIQQNAKFFLEVLAHQKSNSLEWIIIVLIMFECVLMVMEMSGTGEVVFSHLGNFKPSL